jgi:6-phosphogluconolactonase (cycloisomerase 2 family)
VCGKICGSPYNVTGGHLAVDAFNRFLYVTNSGAIAVYRINHPNGSLTPVPGSPFPDAGGPWKIAVDPFGRFIYVANLSSKNTSVFRVLENGALTPVPGSPFTCVSSYGSGLFNGGDPIAVMADPNGRFVHVANEYVANVISYSVASNGALSQTNLPTAFNAAWYENMAIDPFGRALYVDEGISGFIVFHINPTSGLPVAVQGIGVGDTADRWHVGE